MTTFNDYRDDVRALVASLSSYLSASEQTEVLHLIEHDECGEALRTLAWIVVEEKKRIPASAIAAIRNLGRGLVADADLPNDLDLYAIDQQ